jgi:hypothetical protein|tara:strand:+ start:115 stop:555 length:441 start_codon:yes stop_codon:yes gene_type:complete
MSREEQDERNKTSGLAARARGEASEGNGGVAGNDGAPKRQHREVYQVCEPIEWIVEYPSTELGFKQSFRGSGNDQHQKNTNDREEVDVSTGRSKSSTQTYPTASLMSQQCHSASTAGLTGGTRLTVSGTSRRMATAYKAIPLAPSG